MSIVSHHAQVFDTPSLDEQNGNMPAIASFDEGFDQWLQGHERPITPEEDEAAFREYLQEQALIENQPKPAPRSRYFMIRVSGKGHKSVYEIRRDTDGEWVAIIQGRAEAQREVDKLNGAA